MSLTIGRKSGQTIVIGDAVVTVEGHGKIKVRIDAPQHVRILRGELTSQEPKRPLSAFRRSD